MIDKAQLIKWLGGILARGVAWYLTVKLGMGAAEAGATAEGVGQAVGALVLAGISIYSSVKGRKVLLNTEPPVK